MTMKKEVNTLTKVKGYCQKCQGVVTMRRKSLPVPIFSKRYTCLNCESRAIKQAKKVYRRRS